MHTLDLTPLWFKLSTLEIIAVYLSLQQPKMVLSFINWTIVNIL